MDGDGDGGGEGAGDDPMARAAEAAEELYRVRDMFFPVNSEEKLVKLKALADVATGILDSVPADLRKSTIQRGHFEYLRGKVLDVFPGGTRSPFGLDIASCNVRASAADPSQPFDYYLIPCFHLNFPIMGSRVVFVNNFN